MVLKLVWLVWLEFIFFKHIIVHTYIVLAGFVSSFLFDLLFLFGLLHNTRTRTKIRKREAGGIHAEAYHGSFFFIFIYFIFLFNTSMNVRCYSCMLKTRLEFSLTF